MKILVTGGAGFIGSHVVGHYQGRAEVVVLDNLRGGALRNLEGMDCRFIEGSITDRAAVREAARGVDVVIHLAALVSVPESMAKPAECVEINVLGLLNTLDAAVASGARKFVLASSAAVYGDNPVVPKIESMTPEPKSPYAITKLDGEYYLEMARREGRIGTTSLRFFNVFGPRQDPEGPYAAAVPIFMRRALAGDPLEIHGDGGQTRDFTHVTDIVAAIGFAAERDDLGGVFNVGYGTGITIRDLADRILGLAGSDSEIIHRAERAGDVRHSRAAVDKLLAAGFRPASSMDQGLAETLNWFKSARAR